MLTKKEVLKKIDDLEEEIFELEEQMEEPLQDFFSNPGELLGLKIDTLQEKIDRLQLDIDYYEETYSYLCENVG